MHTGLAGGVGGRVVSAAMSGDGSERGVGTGGGASFAGMCKALHREAVAVLAMQRGLGLHVPEKDTGYSDAYVAFMRKVVRLRALHVPLDLIAELFETERKVLALLHVDTLTDSPTWYLDACNGENGRLPPDGLLLSGYRLGFPIETGAVQPTLDFGERPNELFHGHEMGEDLKQVLARYRRQLEDVRERVGREKPVVEGALSWVRVCLR